MTTHAILKFDWKRAAWLLAGFLCITIFGLWAWNTLSELFSGPVAQYKHIVAALILLVIARWSLYRHR